MGRVASRTPRRFPITRPGATVARTARLDALLDTALSSCGEATGGLQIYDLINATVPRPCVRVASSERLQRRCLRLAVAIRPALRTVAGHRMPTTTRPVRKTLERPDGEHAS